MPSIHGNEPSFAQTIEYQHLRLNCLTQQVWDGDRELTLTGTEFRLLAFFLNQPGQVFSREQLVQALTANEAVVGERTVDVHIFHLRKKIGAAVNIETVRGIGYRLQTAT